MKRILNVDDDPDQIYAVKRRLEKIGDYEVNGAESGKQCLEWLKHHEKPDLILLDVMMPEMNGWQVFKQLRMHDEWKDIPIVFLTARTDSFSKGFGKIISDAYIEKPFDVESLQNKIEEILAHPYQLSDTKKQIIDDMMEKAIK